MRRKLKEGREESSEGVVDVAFDRVLLWVDVTLLCSYPHSTRIKVEARRVRWR